MAARPQYTVIDLTSGDSDAESLTSLDPQQPRHRQDLEEDDDFDTNRYRPPGDFPNFMQDQEPQQPPQNQAQAQRGIYVDIDGEQVFIPDEDPDEFLEGVGPGQAVNDPTIRDHEIAIGLQGMDEPGQAAGVEQAAKPADNASVARDREVALALDNQNVTADSCLQRVLEIFPDISQEHVLEMYNDFGVGNDYENLPGQARLDNIIEHLVSAPSYPKQEKGRLKRKREDSIDEGDLRKWDAPDRALVPNYVVGSIRSMLKAEFPDIPHNYILETTRSHPHFYSAYIALAKTQDNDGTARPYGKGRPSNNLANADTIALNCGWPEMSEELKAARTKVQLMRAERRAEDAKKRAEKENLDRAIAAGETAECSCCFDEYPMNRQIHCNGPTAHFTCYECAETYVKTEIGESRCQVLCTSGCGAGFANDQINLLSDKKLLEKLSQLQQEKDIRDANLDDLEECPFCDYKAILPPIEEDFEFRCANSECEKVSCRRCKSVSHIPISCEQHAKDNKINSRHKIEEAMTAAMIRSCNKCKKQFIKEYGCNKMSCPSCGNMQCYVCSVSLKDYNHFDQTPGAGRGAGAGTGKKCPLYDNVEERHEREVKEAEAAARAQVVNDNPDVSVEDLEIKVSDAVKKATADRIRQAGGGVGGADLDPFHVMPVLGYRRPGDRMLAENAVRMGHAGAEELRQNQHAARVAARERLRAEVEAARNAGAARAAQGPGGMVAGLQGFIPVYGLQPQQAQAQPGAAAQTAQGRAQQPRHMDLYDDIGRDNPFVRPRLGGDAAADYNRPANLAPANNNNAFNAGLFGGPNYNFGFGNYVPGAWDNVIQQQRVQREQQDQMRARQQLQNLEMLRQQHDQNLQMRQREQRPAPYEAPLGPNHHYRDYQEQMRRRADRY